MQILISLLLSKIEVGDLVFVLAKFIKITRLYRKLSECYLGPFKVTDKLSTHFYQIKFPQHLCTIHPVFYISQLKPTSPSQIPNCVNSPSHLLVLMINWNIRSLRYST